MEKAHCLESRGINEKAFLIKWEGPISAVDRARIIGKGKKPRADDSQMKVAIGILNVSLIKLLGNLRETDTITRFVTPPPWVFENTSAKVAVDRLNAVVLALAILFAVTSRSARAALRPLGGVKLHAAPALCIGVLY